MGVPPTRGTWGEYWRCNKVICLHHSCLELILSRWLARRLTTLFKMSGEAASCGVKCIRHIPDHTGDKKSAFWWLPEIQWTLTQVPDADQMDEDIHRLVVIRGVEHKLLPKIKKSPALTHFDSVFCKLTLLWNTLCHSIKFLLSEIKTRGYSEQYKRTHSTSSAHHTAFDDLYFNHYNKSASWECESIWLKQYELSRVQASH